MDTPSAVREQTDPVDGAPESLLGLPASQWRQRLESLGVEPYRGDQIARWVWEDGVFDLDAMTDLPLQMRAELAQRIRVEPPPVERSYTSVDGSRRYLLRVEGGLVEAVHMPYEERTTLCISSQVGCRFACTFCQTGKLGLRRSLDAAEIVGQVLRLRSDRPEAPERLNVVFMGQGEPLDNPEAVRRSVRAFQDSRGPDLSWGRVTVSTVGVVPALRELGEMGAERPRIAVSLNATTDEVRSELMPINRKYPIATLLETLRRIPWRPRERVTLEYVLLAGVNDSPEDATRLVKLLQGLPAKVNLIPWNPIAGMAYRRPAPDAIEDFRDAAGRGGLDVLVRYSRGADVGAACGQLQAAAGRSSRLG